METIKKNITLVLGISIPLTMILFVAGSVYLPALFVQPRFNFLYVSGDDYYYGRGREYFIQDGKLVKKAEMKRPMKQLKEGDYSLPPGESKLFIHDVVKNESKEISFDEAQKLNLDFAIQSPDGFEVTYGSREGGIFSFFFRPGGDYDARYLKGHNVSKKLNVHYRNFRFLGWIKS